MKKIDKFISVICIVDKLSNSQLPQVENLVEYIKNRFSFYEIILIHNNRSSSNKLNLTALSNTRILKLRDNPKLVDKILLGIDFSIGDKYLILNGLPEGLNLLLPNIEDEMYDSYSYRLENKKHFFNLFPSYSFIVSREDALSLKNSGFVINSFQKVFKRHIYRIKYIEGINLEKKHYDSLISILNDAVMNNKIVFKCFIVAIILGLSFGALAKFLSITFFLLIINLKIIIYINSIENSQPHILEDLNMGESSFNNESVNIIEH
ncbi:hypothetical protein N9M12_00435 [Gammaproteobacteria bacterium]|nr:hypothetical protein [Gammaproteobacteria bacterium]